MKPSKQGSIYDQYIQKQNNSLQSSILNPTLLTRELDAYYNIFIEKFQKIEENLRMNQISSQNEHLEKIETIFKTGRGS